MAKPALLVATLLGNAPRSVISSEKKFQNKGKPQTLYVVKKEK